MAMPPFTLLGTPDVAAGKPVDETLMSTIVNNINHVEEWLGKDFASVENHNHDGLNSALVEVGPNYIRNGSFESSSSGWVLTPNKAEIVPTGVSNDSSDGANVLRIDCTVIGTANSGSATSTEFIPVTQGDVRQFVVNIRASVANLHSKVEVIWYDKVKAENGAAVVLLLGSNVPTSRRTLVRRATAPLNTRYARLRLTAGSEGGSGYVYFDSAYHCLPPTPLPSVLYNVAGSYSFSVDDFVALGVGDSISANISLCGGGGGGSGTTEVGPGTEALGGIASEYKSNIKVKLAKGAVVSVTVGAGGPGGYYLTNNGVGNSGGQSVFGGTEPNRHKIIANGGVGGEGASGGSVGNRTQNVWNGYGGENGHYDASRSNSDLSSGQGGGQVRYGYGYGGNATGSGSGKGQGSAGGSGFVLIEFTAEAA